jgi:hypothetical protein
MSKLVFKASDFKAMAESYSPLIEACTIAQRIYDEHLEKLPKVICQKLKESNLSDEHGPGWWCAEERKRRVEERK